MAKFHTLIGVILLSNILLGCSPHIQYRTDYTPCNTFNPLENCKDSAIQLIKEGDAEYILTFIEFDDQGQLWDDRKQLNKVEDRIAREPDDLLMIVFIHGWMHSARPGDRNVEDFRRALSRISLIEKKVAERKKDKPRKVIGIYLGWRGKSITAPIVKHFTFWDRKNAAHKVGNGSVINALAKLELIRKSKHKIAANENKKSNTRMIVVGHSFGGAAIFSALNNILQRGAVQTEGAENYIGSISGFADLVVLINPAFEALRFSSLSDMANERRYFDAQKPRLVILNSEADWETEYLFPMGRWFSTFFEKERVIYRKDGTTKKRQKIDQREANLTSVGHFKSYHTHRLEPVENVDKTITFNVEETIKIAQEALRGWKKDKPGGTIYFGISKLTRSKTSAAKNPYLVIDVDKELIKGHGDINNPYIEHFIRQLIITAL